MPESADNRTRTGDAPSRQSGDIGLSVSRGKTASFGAFRLHVTERLLEKNGRPVKIGSRALDILITLLEHAPAVVTKRELIQRAWGQLVVDDVSLRVHVANLRKQLGDVESLGCAITNVQGRGYCLVGQVTWTIAGATPGIPPAAPQRLPRPPLLMVGRDEVVRELTSQLTEHRFLSIVGAGGIGKTTVALALAHRMLGEFQGAVRLFELAALEDPRLLASMLTSELGLVAVSDEPLPVITTFLREQRMLLVFDSCEHVIEAVAALTENIFRNAPRVHILVTSREALRAEGEHVHHLPSLECPPAYMESLTAAQALSFPAVQLFVKQVASSGHSFELVDDDALIVAEICRRLDGIALALEIAAARVGVHGVKGTASLLDRHFRLLWRGRRTALPRHQTLGATLDWSYNLLSGTEQLVLRRLAIFAGDFSLAAALEVASEGVDAAELTETLATLVDKSLVASDDTTAMRYRLLETTRAYSRKKLVESGEDNEIAQRHCQHLIHVIETFGSEVWARPSHESVEFFVSNLNNVRTALDWCFSDQGDNALGVRLTGASACLFIQAGLLPECVAWTERATAVLDATAEGTRIELELLACFSQSLMVTRGNIPAARAAIVRALDIAGRLEFAHMEMYLLHALYKWQIRNGDFCSLRELAARIEATAKQVADPLADAIANALVAVAYFFTGKNREVQRHVETALAAPDHLSKLNVAIFGRVPTAKAISARNLWVIGYPERAMLTVMETVKEAEELNHPFTLCYVLMSGVVVALETGSWHTAEDLIWRLSSIASKHHLSSYTRASVGWQGRLAVSLGDLERGIESLQTAIATLHEDGYELYRPEFGASLAEGLAKAGHWARAYSTICEELRWAEARGRVLNLVDLLRVKGEILISMPDGNAGEGETCLLRALELAQRQDLLSLELRSGVSVARFWADSGRFSRARELLEPIVNRFSEGFATHDLVTGANLLDRLCDRDSPHD